MSIDSIRLSDSDLVNAERWVLGSIMMAGFDCLNDLPLEARDFDEPRHEELFSLMRLMNDNGQRVTQDAVLQHLQRQPITGVPSSYLHVLVGSVIHPVSAEYHGEFVMKEAHYRRLRALAMRFTQMVDERLDADDIGDRMRNWLTQAEVTTTSDIVMMGDAVDEAFERVTRPNQSYPTPWGELNKIIGGWRPGRLYLVGARPGNGKSILGVNAAVHHAEVTRTAVAITSLEMDRVEITQRAMCARARVDFSEFVNDRLPPHDDAHCDTRQRIDRRCPSCRMAEAGAHVRGLLLPVDDDPSQKPTQIKGFIRRVSRKHPLGMVVIDYLQLMDETRGSDEKRHEQVSKWSRAMKIMARELGVPVMVLSQLNRDVDSRPDRIPRLSDLRESGSLEQDADVVLLLSTYERDQTKWVTVNVAKNRQGPTEAFDLLFSGNYMRLEES